MLCLLNKKFISIGSIHTFIISGCMLVKVALWTLDTGTEPLSNIYFSSYKKKSLWRVKSLYFIVYC